VAMPKPIVSHPPHPHPFHHHKANGSLGAHDLVDFDVALSVLL